MAITSLWPAVVGLLPHFSSRAFNHLLISGYSPSNLQQQQTWSDKIQHPNATSAKLYNPFPLPFHFPCCPNHANFVAQQTIFSDAVLAILNSPTAKVNGLLDLDEDFLRRECGVTDFSKYAVVPGSSPRRIMPAKFPSLEVEEQDDEGRRMDSTQLRAGRAKIQYFMISGGQGKVVSHSFS